MLPGPDEIFECPNCKNLISRESLISGNTFDARFYSDGKRIAPMLPEFPSITICKKCRNIFWLDEVNQIETNDFEIPGNNNLNTDRAEFLTVEEYFLVLDRNIFRNKDEELHIRLRIWWGFNDRIRDNKDLFKNEEERNLWNLNAKRLLEILDENIIDHKIMSAELYRNMGEFIKCMEIIRSIDDENLNWLKDAFEKVCSVQNTKVFEFSK